MSRNWHEKRRRKEARRKARMKRRLARSRALRHGVKPIQKAKEHNMDHNEADILFGSGIPALESMLADCIDMFKTSEKGKYLIMCLAMTVDATDYQYKPIAGGTDDLRMVSELFARAKERFFASVHKPPNMMLAAIAKRGDTDDQMKGVFLEPLSLVLRAASQGTPLPGSTFNGISYLITASLNLDPEEMEQLRRMSERSCIVIRCREDDEETGSGPPAAPGAPGK